MTLTREQVIANIDAMEKQGASQEDIQSYLDVLPKPETTQQPSAPQNKTIQSSQDVLADYKAGNITQQVAKEKLRNLRPTSEQKSPSIIDKIKNVFTVPEAKAEAPGILGGGTPTLDYLGNTLINTAVQGGTLLGGIADATTKPLRQVFSPIENRPLASLGELKQRVQGLPSSIAKGGKELIKNTAESFGVKVTPEEGLKISPYITAAKLKREPINTLLDLSVANAGGKAFYKALKGEISEDVASNVAKNISNNSEREQARIAAANSEVKTYSDIAYKNADRITSIKFKQLENPRYVQDQGKKLAKKTEILKNTHLDSVNKLLKENAEQSIDIGPKLNSLYKELESDNLGSFVTEKVSVPQVIQKNKYGLPEIQQGTTETEISKFRLDPLFNKPKTGQIINALPVEMIENQNVLNGIIDELNLGTITVQKADRIRKILDTQIKWGKDLVIDNAARKIRTLLSESIGEAMPDVYSKKMVASHLTLQDYNPFFKQFEKVGGGESLGMNETYFSNKSILHGFKNTLKKYAAIEDTKTIANSILGEVDNLGAWHDWQNLKMSRGNVLPGTINRNLPIPQLVNDWLAKGVSRVEYEFIKRRFARQLGDKTLKLLENAIIQTPKVIKQIPKGVKIQEDIINTKE